MKLDTMLLSIGMAKPQLDFNIDARNPNRHASSPRKTVSMIVCIMIATTLLSDIAYGCIGPLSIVKGRAESVRAALAAYAGDSDGNLFPRTSMIASYADLVRIANRNGANLPAKEPEAETRWARILRDLRGMWLAVWRGTGCNSACPPAHYTFAQYNSEDGQDYRLLFKVHNPYNSQPYNPQEDYLVIVTPAGIEAEKQSDHDLRKVGGHD